MLYKKVYKLKTQSILHRLAGSVFHCVGAASLKISTGNQEILSSKPFSFLVGPNIYKIIYFSGTHHHEDPERSGENDGHNKLHLQANKTNYSI